MMTEDTYKIECAEAAAEQSNESNTGKPAKPLPTREQRIKRSILITAAIVGVGLLYSLFVRIFDIGIPCVFHLITRLNCPGCGISRFCMAALKGHWIEAIGYNYMAPVYTVYVIGIYIEETVRYVKNGRRRIGKPTEIITWCLLGITVVWVVLRNIWGI